MSPDFRRYAAGQAVSVLGDQVYYVALSWVAVRIASPGTAGMLLAVSAVPRLLLMLSGGVLVDRTEPRRLMMVSDLARAVVCLAAAAVALRQASIPLLVVVALAFGVADAVFLPAAGALQPRLLEPERYAGGNAVVATLNRLALTLGAPLGGLLVAAGGFSAALLVDAATFAVSVLALRTLRPRPAARPSTKEEAGLRDGLRYVARHPVLRGALLAGLLANLGFVGPMNVGLALSAEAAGWGATGIGILLAGFGFGAIVTGLLMVRPRISRIAPIVAGCFAVQGIAVVVPALTASLPLAVAATFVAGLTSGPTGILLSALTQAATGDAYRGRVAGVSSVANLGLTPLAMSAMGVAAGWFGLRPAMTVSGLLELGAAAVCLALPALRDARLPARVTELPIRT